MNFSDGLFVQLDIGNIMSLLIQTAFLLSKYSDKPRSRKIQLGHS